jgi:hypothetical protein
MSSTQTATQKILDQLRQQELKMNSNPVQTYWQQQPSNLADQFFQQQRNLMSERGRLENVELQKLSNALSSFEADLSASCKNLSRELDALDNTTALLKAVSHLTSVIGQTIRLVA